MRIVVPCIYALAAVVGWVAASFHLPLAWVLGPMLVTAGASMSGVALPKSQAGRKVGQLIVGSSIGLTMTPEDGRILLEWSPLMLMTALVTVVVTVLLTVPFARLTRQNHATAFFSMTAGGLSEMARVGTAEGARTEVVALSQAIRVALLVTFLPQILRHFGEDGGLAAQADRAHLSPLLYAGILVLCLGAVRVVRWLGASNPWTIGALLTSALLGGFGVVDGIAPHLPYLFGQYMIGSAIGTRFERDKMRGIGGILGFSVLFVVVMSLLLVAYAWGLSALTGFGLSTMVLVASPGGMAEMALTAGALHLNVVLVTAFHVIRSFVVNAGCVAFYRLFQRKGVFAGLERGWNRLLPGSTR